MKTPRLKIESDTQGQDLIEYTLLMAFVLLASVALFMLSGGSVKGIWTTTNSQLPGNAQRTTTAVDGQVQNLRALLKRTPSIDTEAALFNSFSALYASAANKESACDRI